jgi:hypothetical protein
LVCSINRFISISIIPEVRCIYGPTQTLAERLANKQKVGLSHPTIGVNIESARTPCCITKHGLTPWCTPILQRIQVLAR